MPDDSLSPADKTVVAVCEIVAFALGWTGIDRMLAGNSVLVVLPIFIACVAISYFGFKWPSLKSRIPSPAVLAKVERLAVSYRIRVGVIFLFAFMGLVYLLTSLHSLRSDVDAYSSPRKVTQEQTGKLKEYLSPREPSTVSVQFVWYDQEASEYAAELRSALSQTNWDVKGPDYLQSQPYQRRKRNDVDVNGKPLYKTDEEYRAAHDVWIEQEIDRQTFQKTYGSDPGCNIHVDFKGQITNPDEKHPRPDTVLTEALQFAGIWCNGSSAADRGAYSLILIVGHRPREIRKPAWWMPLYQRITSWLFS